MCITFPLMLSFAATYQAHPILSLGIFLIMGFTTMLAQPVTVVMAQEILPKYKSIVAGLMVGFSWGVIAVLLSAIGIIAERFGIINVLVIAFIFPVLSSYFIKFLGNKKE